MPPRRTRISVARLDSWKEIAAYLGRDVRTVQRWERFEGLPVHRHRHAKLGSVYAFRHEIDAWTGSRTQRDPTARSPHDTPGGGLIGREREWSFLREAFEEVRSGTSLMAGIRGEPGIGKTALVEQFLRGLAHEHVGAVSAVGRCFERLSRGHPYLPFSEAFQSLADASKRPDVWRQAAPHWPARASSRDPVARSTLHAEAIAACRALSRHKPVVLWLEDVHWADAATLQLAHDLVLAPDAMILVIVSYRSAEIATEPGGQFEQTVQALTRQRAFREIVVGRWTEDDVSRYLAARGIAASTRTIAALHDRSGGNPLFLSELLREVKIRYGDGVSVLDASATDIETTTPRTVLAAIDHHLSLLTGNAREMLQVACVQGEYFDSAVIARVLAVDPVLIEESLHNLELRHDLITRHDRDSASGLVVSVRYAFTHVLYREALLQSLTATQLARLSGVVADAVDALHQGPGAPKAIDLALLYRDARQPEASARWFRVAAKMASQVSAFDEVVTLARSGLQQIDMSPLYEGIERDRLELQMLLAVGSMPAHFTDPGALKASFEDSGLGTTAQTDPRAEFVAHGGQFLSRYMAGSIDAAREAARAQLAIATRIDDAALTAEARVNLFLVDFEDADRAYEHSLEALSAVRRSPTASRSFAGLSLFVEGVLEHAWIQWRRGLFTRARDAVNLAKVAAASWNPVTQIYLGMYGAVVLYLLGDFHNAASEATLAGDLVHDTSIAVFSYWLKALEGAAQVQIGRVSDGFARLAESFATARMPPVHFSFLQTLHADVCLARRRVDAGLSACDAALTTAARIRYHLIDSWAHRVRGELLTCVNNTDGAASELRQAIEVARRQHAPAEQLHALVALHRIEPRVRDEIAAVVSRFTEGLDEPLLKAALATVR